MTIFDNAVIQHIVSQGIPHSTALELASRRASSRHLTGVVVGGKWVTLVPATGKKFDEMIEAGVGPYLNTDAVFMTGTANGSQFEMRPEQGEYYKAECEKRGGTTLGRKYFSSLARFPGDPEAWVEGRGEVSKLLSSRGWGAQGAVYVKPVPVEEVTNPVDVASDIVDREVAKIAGSEKLSKKAEVALREKVKDRIRPSWKKKK